MTEQPTLTIPQVGAPITSRADLRALPMGATVRGEQGSLYQKRGEGDAEFIVTYSNHRKNPIGRVRKISGFTFGGMTLESLAHAAPVDPAGQYDEETPVTYETLTQAKAWFYTSIWGSAIASGIGERTIRAAMLRLRCAAPEPSLGMSVDYYDYHTIATLPEGTVIRFGHNGGTWVSMSTWGRTGQDVHHQGQGLVHLLGGLSYPTHVRGVVVSGPLPRLPWVDEAGDSASQQAVVEWKDEAWRVGMDEKADNGWCAELESSLRRAGVSARNRENHATFSVAEVAALPVGSLLRVEVPEGGRIFIRNDASTNPCRTIGFGGNLPGHWAHSMMLCRRGPNERGEQIPVHSHGELDAMPVGTRIASHGSTYQSDHYVKQQDGSWSIPGYSSSHPATAFSVTSMSYAHIPTEGIA